LCLSGDGAASTVRISIVNLGPISAAEREFLDNESRYRALYESMRDAFALIDMAGNLQLFNRPFREMLGYGAAELKSRTCRDLTPERWHAPEARIIAEQVLVEGESPIYEKEFRRKDGTVLPVELKTVLVKDKDGQPSGMWAVVRDISERKRSEARLVESESRFRLAMQAVAGVVYDWNMVDDTAWLSGGMLNLLGKSFAKPTSMGDNWAKHIHPDDRGPVRAQVVQALRSGTEQFQVVYRLRHKKGHWVHVSDHGLIVYGADGRAVRMVGSLTDISARVAAEAALRSLNDSLEQQVRERSTELTRRVRELHESELFIRSTLDAMIPAVCVIDANGALIFKNKVWQEIESERACDVRRGDNSLGRNYSPYCCNSTLGDGCQAKKRIEAAVHAVLTRKRKNISFEYETGDPSATHWYFAKLSCFKGDGPVRVVLSHEDVTERKLAANEVIRSAKNFKLMLRKMGQANEVHSKQIAREVHDQLGATLTMLKLGLATTMQDKSLAGPVQAKFKGMIELADMALQSVKRVTASLRPSMLDTLGLVAAINWHAKEFSRMTGIETMIDAPVHVKLSVERAESAFRIVQEAMTNVAKHAKASKVEIVIRMTKRQLVVTISDNGSGLQPGKSNQQNSFGVIGMRERAEHLKGALLLENQPAGGVRVTLNIPLDLSHT
ncbi:MAG: PAS domain S-box protein, partial [Rhodocyclaceae bacterium]